MWEVVSMLPCLINSWNVTHYNRICHTRCCGSLSTFLQFYLSLGCQYREHDLGTTEGSGQVPDIHHGRQVERVVQTRRNDGELTRREGQRNINFVVGTNYYLYSFSPEKYFLKLIYNKILFKKQSVAFLSTKTEIKDRMLYINILFNQLHNFTPI